MSTLFATISVRPPAHDAIRPRASSRRASRAKTYFVPKSQACSYARWASSAPLMPPGNRGSSGSASWCRPAAYRFTLDDDGAQSLRGSIHGGRETRRPSPDDDEVAGRFFDVGGAKSVHDLGVRGIGEDVPVEEDDGGQPGRIEPRLLDEPQAVLGARA